MTALADLGGFFDVVRTWLDAAVRERWLANRGARSEDEKIEIRSERDRQLYAGRSVPCEHGGQGLGLREEVLFHEPVIWASLEPENARRAAAYALDTAIEVGEGSIQVHGGMGFTLEMSLHFYLRSLLLRRRLVHGLWA